MSVRIQGIACDFGNVNGAIDHRLATAGFAAVCDSTSDEVYDAIFNSSLEGQFDCGLPTSDFLSEIRQTLKISSDVSDERLKAIWNGIFQRTADNERVIDTLRRVAPQVKIVLASNTNCLHFAVIQSGWADLLSYLDDVVVSHLVGSRKPSVAFFDAVLDALGTSPSETLLIDDRADLVQASIELGWTGLQYHPGLNLAARLAEFQIPLDHDRATAC